MAGWYLDGVGVMFKRGMNKNKRDKKCKNFRDAVYKNARTHVDQKLYYNIYITFYSVFVLLLSNRS